MIITRRTLPLWIVVGVVLGAAGFVVAIANDVAWARVRHVHDVALIGQGRLPLV